MVSDAIKDAVVEMSTVDLFCLLCFVAGCVAADMPQAVDMRDDVLRVSLP